MAITNSSAADLHIIFMPFPSPGHMIPLVDIAKIMSRRPGIRATVVTIVGNASRIHPAIAGHDNLILRTLPFPSETDPENSTDLPTPEFTSDFVDAQMALEGPFETLMRELDHRPEAIISDSLLPWCTGVTATQLREMAMGLEACDHPFIWVIRNGGDESEWMPEGFEKRVVGSGKGLIVRGWVPQVLVLNHPNVGGFVTHSGYNSMLEGVASGIPMVTWPLFFDHFFAERLVLDVLKIGIPAGSKVSSYRKEERTLITGEQLKEAVNELMGRGEEAEERRRRAKNLAAMARCAVEEGGSSYKGVTDMIQELVNIKMGKVTAF